MKPLNITRALETIDYTRGLLEDLKNALDAFDEAAVDWADYDLVVGRLNALTEELDRIALFEETA